VEVIMQQEWCTYGSCSNMSMPYELIVFYPKVKDQPTLCCLMESFARETEDIH
jgi:hypothetical protein